MWRSPFSTFPWLDLLGVSAIVEPNTTIVTNIGEYNFPTPRVHLSPNLRLPLKQFSLHPHVWIYVPSRRDLESFSLPCPLPCYVRPFVSFRGKAGNIGFADLTARYLSPLLAQGRVYIARTGALGFTKNRVLPEPEPPITRIFLFLAYFGCFGLPDIISLSVSVSMTLFSKTGST